jgi:uncharacterized protein (TIGR03435 family)
MKFFLPFSLLALAGEALRPASAPAVRSFAVTTTIDNIAQPLAGSNPVALAAQGASGHGNGVLAASLAAIWMLGVLVIVTRWWRQWRQIQDAMRVATALGEISGVPVLSTSSAMEPGIFGIFTPVLLMPDRIPDRLTAPQLEAIVAHELCHVRRRDNLTYAMHMIAESVFWFHPLVWWISARLVEERERACDEAVVQSGNMPDVYAQGILNVCRCYVESPLACAAGVTGSDLKQRIVRIMADRIAPKLDLSRKLLLTVTGFATLAIPVAIGSLHPVRLLAQAQDAPTNLPKYAVSTVKPSKGEDNRIALMFQPDGVSMTGVPAQMMIRQAFDVEDDRIAGAPAWVKSLRFDLEAKVDAADAAKLKELKIEERSQMLQPLLVERFGLKFHHETRQLPVYSLVVAKGGVKLKESPPGETSGTQRMNKIINTSPEGIHVEGNGSKMESLAHLLSSQVGRTVLDKTGLTGIYDYKLNWTPENMPLPMAGGPGGPAPGGDGASAPSDSSGASLFTALQEQLGLKLESAKGPVDVIVIDHIDKPSGN